jgi:S1-C subfamily serine protease
MWRLLTLLTLFLVSEIKIYANSNTWPKNIEQYLNSICIVEFYQPQNENSEIKDRSRIKKNLIGLLVSDSGLILTTEEIYPANLDISSSSFYFHQSQHLPEDITVEFENDQKFKATFLGKDEETKLAFLKIDNPKILPSHIRFKTNTSLVVGQPIFLIERLNEKYDFEPIVNSENINSIIRKPRKKLLINSNLNVLSNGGLVLDLNGNAIGIVQNNRGIYGYPDDMIESQSTIIEVLLATDFEDLISKPPILSDMKNGTGKNWLGIQMQILTKEMAKYWGLGNTSGIIINKIMPDSPSENAGLKIGDIIISINDFQLNGDDRINLDIFRNHVRNLSVQNVQVGYIRNGNSSSTNVTLKSAPKSKFLAEEKLIEDLGFSVKELTQDIFLNYNIDFDTEGVWVSQVESAGIASIAGLRLGDLILNINNKKISNLNEFDSFLKSVLEEEPEYIQFFILRQNKTQFLFFKIRKDTNKS